MRKTILVIAVASLSLCACSTLQSGVANSAPVSDQTKLNDAKLAFTVAASLYDGICNSAAAPKSCADPKAIAAEASVKMAAASTFDAAQQAINGSGNLSQDQIDALIADAVSVAAQISTMSAGLK